MSSVLIIDDDTDMLAMTARWLQKSGYEVSTSDSGKEALSVLSGLRPDLILLDHRMPEMDGPAVLKEIRSDEALKDIPVLYRTGAEDIDESQDADQPKPDGIVPKSGGRPALVKAVGEILGD